MAWSILCSKLNAVSLRQTLIFSRTAQSAYRSGWVKSVPCHEIHCSPTRQALPAVLILALRPIMKISAMLFGRSIRKWWLKLPPDRRQQVWNRIKGKQTYITAGFTIITGAGLLFYVEHIEEDPLTKRKRVILYSEEQMQEISDLEFQREVTMHRAQLFPPSHPIYRRVVRVANQILQANNSLPQVKNKTWSVTVIDRSDIANAFVLPNGKIVIFRGILNIASNDDQLAIVLSHEISHALLQHSAENLSKAFFVEMVLVIPIIMLWALLPDAGALFSQWVSSRLADLMINLPFNRAIEKEADIFGLALAAKACFDVREAPVFWGKMREVNDESEPLEWLSTHPSNESRQIELSQLLPAALDIRANCFCPRLPPQSGAQLYYGRGRLASYMTNT